MKKILWCLGIVVISISMVGFLGFFGCKPVVEEEAVEEEVVEEEVVEEEAVEEEVVEEMAKGEVAVLNSMKDLLKYLGTSDSDINALTDVNSANLKLNEYFNSLGSHEYLNQLWLYFSKVGKTSADWVDKDLAAFYDAQGWEPLLEAFAGEFGQVGDAYGGYSFVIGMGEDFVGEISNLNYKDLYTSYVPLPEGPVLDPDKTYKIGFTNLGLAHPWLLANAENALWEASKHPNIEFELLDGEFDEAKMGTHIDAWIAQGFDGIMVWPATEEPLVGVVQRAFEAGIPCIDMDRKVNYEEMYHVAGNIIQNGLQNGLYIIQETMGGGGIIALSRKPMGASVDAGRTGGFVSVLGDFSGYEIAASYHTDSNAEKSYEAIKAALTAHDLDIVFTTGDEETKGAVTAIIEADRMDTGKYGKILVVASDDAKAILEKIKAGSVDAISPYTPLTGALGLRALITQIGIREGIIEDMPDFPQTVIIPNVPIITQENEIIFGVETLTPDQWPHGYGE